LAEFIRQNLVAASLSFSFETVMSDPRKVDFLDFAKKLGYRVYLYYFSTKDPMININRVNLRMAQHGHPVDPQIIESRYYRSLENLKEAVLISDRAYIFDNSGSASILIAEIEEGKHVHVIDPENVPEWFIKYLVEKRP
jgi:predicted ABC-type ATPase